MDITNNPSSSNSDSRPLDLPVNKHVKLGATTKSVVQSLLQPRSDADKGKELVKSLRKYLEGTRDENKSDANLLLRLTYILGSVELPDSDEIMSSLFAKVQRDTKSEDFLKSTIARNDQGKFFRALVLLLGDTTVIFGNEFRDCHDWSNLL